MYNEQITITCVKVPVYDKATPVAGTKARELLLNTLKALSFTVESISFTTASLKKIR